MPAQAAAPPINQPRYQKRAQEDAWISAYLQQATYGMLATEWQGQPFLKPTLFVYDEVVRAIYIHGAQEGRMLTNLQANPRVSFCAAEMGRLLPGETAMSFDVEYTSVVVFGTAHLVEDEAEAKAGLQRLLDKYFPKLRPGEDYRAIQPEELAVTAVYRIDIEQWSGKQGQGQ